MSDSFLYRPHSERDMGNIITPHGTFEFAWGMDEEGDRFVVLVEVEE